MYRRSSSSHSESGYILLAVLFMMALILIALAVAAPRITASIQRDREDDLLHRGLQYKRAIKLYYKKFGRYPSSIDQLENTNNMRFLRKRYVDPMTGKDDWKIIHFGEAHVRATGLFGKPIDGGGLSSTMMGGATPGIYAPTVGTPIGNGTDSSSGSSTDASGSSTSGTGTDSSGSSSSTSGTLGTSPTGSSGFSSGPGIGSSGIGSSPGGIGSSPGGIGGSTGGIGSSPGGIGSTPGTTGFGSGDSSFGGAPMVGIVSKNTKASIMEYKKQKHYNEWEFVYDPLEDLLSSVSLFGGGGTSNVTGTSGTTPGTPGTTNPGSTTSPFGSSNPSSGTGTTGGYGPGSSTMPTSPQ